MQSNSFSHGDNSMNQVVIDRIRAFWKQYSHEANFLAMAKLIKGTLQLCDFRLFPELIDEVEKMTVELEDLTAIMEFKEFFTCTKTIQYARRQISNKRGISYAAGLSRQLSNEQLDELRSASAESDRSRLEGAGSGDEGFTDIIGDLRDDPDDSDEA
jgi:hypothetical protein